MQEFQEFHPQPPGVIPLRLHTEPAQAPEGKKYTERLQLATKQNSMQLLGKVAVGDFSASTSFDFATRTGELATTQANGTLYTQADTALNNAWDEDAQKKGMPPEEWIKRVTSYALSSKRKIENNVLLHQLGFHEDISSLNKKQAKQKVQEFLRTDVIRYFGSDGIKNLADTITKDLKGKTDQQEIAKEVERIRTMLTKETILKSNSFICWIFVNQVQLDSFRAIVELRVADTLHAFDYRQALAEEPNNVSFYTKPLRKTPANEPAILDYLAKGNAIATTPARRTAQAPRPIPSVPEPPAQPAITAANAADITPIPFVVKPAQPPTIEDLATLTLPIDTDIFNKDTQVLAPTEQTARPETPVSFDANVGVSESQGLRSYMEDRYVVETNFGGRADQALFAVFDGHGEEGKGHIVAEFAQAQFPANLEDALQSPGISPENALAQAYKVTEEQIETGNLESGSTAVTALIQGKTLTVANAGDARAVLIRKDNTAEQLTVDHTIYDLEEGKLFLERYEKEKEAVQQQSREKVNKYSTVPTKGLGDIDVLGVSHEPYTKTIKLTSDDKWLLLTCDGAWERGVLTIQEAADLIKDIDDPQEATEIIKNAVQHPGVYGLKNLDGITRERSEDNLTILAIKLVPPTEDEEEKQ